MKQTPNKFDSGCRRTAEWLFSCMKRAYNDEEWTSLIFRKELTRHERH